MHTNVTGFFVREINHNKILIQILVVNWDIFIATNDPNVSSPDMRPALKLVFNDCTQITPNSTIQKWEENYQVENLAYSMEDCIGLLHVLYQRNMCYPPSRRLWPPNMKTSFLFYLPEETILV